MLEKLASLSVGLAGFIGGLWIILLIIRALKDRKSDGNGSKSAGLTAAEWKNEIRAAVKDALTDTKAQRHEDLRQLMKETLEREFLERNEKLKVMMKEVIGDWLDMRLNERRREGRR